MLRAILTWVLLRFSLAHNVNILLGLGKSAHPIAILHGVECYGRPPDHGTADSAGSTDNSKRVEPDRAEGLANGLATLLELGERDPDR